MDQSPRPFRRTAPPRPASIRRGLVSCTVVLAATGLVGGVAPAAQAAPADGPAAPAAVAAPADGPAAPAAAPARIEPFAAYQPQSTCSPTAKPGTRALANMLLAYYASGRNGGITRKCSIGGRSEHKEGRAFDWMLNVNRPTEKATAQRFIAWLLGEGPKGEAAYNARRLGVMYVIWNRRIWSASHAGRGWLPYRGPNPHVDHIHISLAWAGARKETSFWTGVAADVGGGGRHALDPGAVPGDDEHDHEDEGQDEGQDQDQDQGQDQDQDEDEDDD